MRFRVHCANRDTGEEYDWEVDCATIQEAEQQAQDAGMLVSRVEAIGDIPLVEARPQQEQVQQVAPPERVCPACGSSSFTENKGDRSLESQIATVLMIVSGLVFTSTGGILAWTAGPLIVLLGLLMARRHHKGVKCDDCGYVLSNYGYDD